VYDINEYQARAGDTAIYPKERGLEYTALGLAGEAGEYANKVKKVIRDGADAYDRQAFAAELGDVLWYVAMAAEELGYGMEYIARINLEKLAERQAGDKIQGAGDYR